jgi:hypothetical protein
MRRPTRKFTFSSAGEGRIVGPMSTRLRIVTGLVLSLLLQAVAPLSFATCTHLDSQPAMTGDAMPGHAAHAMPADGAGQAMDAAHACCGGDSPDDRCSGGDCAMGGCLSVMMPVALYSTVVAMPAAEAVALTVLFPSPPLAFHFRPPIA